MRMVTAIFFFILATSARAEPPHISSGGGDILRLEPCDPWTCVYYLNDAGENSDSQVRVFDVNGAKVEVRIGFSDKGPEETITVEPLDAGVIAEPPYAEIPDGGDIHVKIMIPLF